MRGGQSDLAFHVMQHVATASTAPICSPLLTVGVNAASAPPAVPKNTPFIWRDEPSGKQLLAMWHPGGYSGWPVDSADQCVQVRKAGWVQWNATGLWGFQSTSCIATTCMAASAAASREEARPVQAAWHVLTSKPDRDVISLCRTCCIVLQVAGLRHALCFAWRGDNAGPHTIEEVSCAPCSPL